MAEPFWARLCNSTLIAVGDLALLSLLFSLFRVRSHRARYAWTLAALLHSLAGFLFISPLSCLSLLVRGGLAVREGGLLSRLDAYLFWGWFLSSLGVLALRLWRMRRVYRGLSVLCDLAPVRDPDLRRRVRTMAIRLGCPIPKLCVVEADLATPFVVGCRSPILVFPSALLRSLRGNEIEGIIAHELSHIRGKDLAINFALEVVRSLLFFSPAHEAIVRRLAEETEKRCDREACELLGKPHWLASGLSKVSCQGGDPAVVAALPFCATFVTPRRGLAQRRIDYMLEPSARLRLGVVCAQLMSLLLVLPVMDPAFGFNAVEVQAAVLPDSANAPVDGTRLTIGIHRRFLPWTLRMLEEQGMVSEDNFVSRFKDRLTLAASLGDR